MAQEIHKDPDMFVILSEMWRLNNKIARKEELTSLEKSYYNGYLSLIQTYYQSYGTYWKVQPKQ